MIDVHLQARIHQNQPYDESLEVPDAEEIASTYSPTPRAAKPGGTLYCFKCHRQFRKLRFLNFNFNEGLVMCAITISECSCMLQRLYEVDQVIHKNSEEVKMITDEFIKPRRHINIHVQNF